MNRKLCMQCILLQNLIKIKLQVFTEIYVKLSTMCLFFIVFWAFHLITAKTVTILMPNMSIFDISLRACASWGLVSSPLNYWVTSSENPKSQIANTFILSNCQTDSYQNLYNDKNHKLHFTDCQQVYNKSKMADSSHFEDNNLHICL